MSKNNKAPQKKEEKKENKTPKAPAAPKSAPKVAAAPEKKEDVETAEIVTIPQAADPKNILSRKHSGLSPDGQVRLLDLARRTFVEETDPELQFPQTVRKEVNKIVAIGIMCTLADHAANGDNTFALVLQSQAYPSLSAAADAIGFKLPDIKALPAGKEEGTLMLPADSISIPKETKETLKKEKKIREGEKPELDPTKIDSEEGVKKALEYIFSTTSGKRMPDIIANGIDFIKKFREHEAELAENTEEAKAKFANYNAGDWLDDIFGYFRPTVFFNGIGRGMAAVTDIEKSPIHAFTIFREAIKSKETGNPVMSDQDIAYCVKSIIKWVCNTNVDSNKKAIDNLDKEKNKAEIEKCEAQIQKYNNILANITSPSSDEVDKLLERIGSQFNEGGQLTQECQTANTTFNRVCETYYGKKLSGVDYKNLDENVQQYAGCILNYFLPAGSQLASYKLSNITELVERPEEERKAMAQEAKKAWAERKVKQKEEATKNV